MNTLIYFTTSKTCTVILLIFCMLQINAQTIVNVMADQPEKLEIVADEMFSQKENSTILGEKVIVKGGIAPYQYSWTNNGQLIGTTLVKEVSKFTPTSSLLLTVIDRNKCSVTRDALYTGIDELNAGNFEVNVYPNPATRFIIVDSHETGQLLDVSIYNSVGQRLIHTKTESKSTLYFNLSSGMYLVKIEGMHNHMVKLSKLIVL